VIGQGTGKTNKEILKWRCSNPGHKQTNNSDALAETALCGKGEICVSPM
jgi:hypothetical protein